MCTLIVLHRCVAATPLVVAANRDEYFDRPASGPALRQTSSGTLVAPRDERAGGTWLGLNGSGVFAAVTNRRAGSPGKSPDPNRRSRGLIVMDVLGAHSAREAAEGMESLRADAHDPFNLLVADGRTAHVFSFAERLERLDLAPGAHVIGNVHPTDRTEPKLVRLRREAAAAARAGGDEVLDRLAAACRSHAGDAPLEATCVHAGPYGTRSSTLLRLGETDAELRYSDAAPCEREYSSFTSLLCELGLAPGRFAGQATARKVS
jgi:uncharacterized protein with NRDE domain